MPALYTACMLRQENACAAPADMCRRLPQAEAAANAQQSEAFEIDQWILDFANLFREQLNIEPDKHLDLTNMGWDKLQAALDSAVQSDKAPAIFDAAADKFQEVSAHGELLFSQCSAEGRCLLSSCLVMSPAPSGVSACKGGPQYSC